MGQTRPLFCLFSFFSHDKYSKNTINDKSIDCVLGTRTQGGMMVGADKSTELWRQPDSHYSQFGLTKQVVPQNTHQMVQYHCTADLQFVWFGFDQTRLNCCSLNPSKAAEVKPNKQEVSCTMILPTTMSVLWYLVPRYSDIHIPSYIWHSTQAKRKAEMM